MIAADNNVASLAPGEQRRIALEKLFSRLGDVAPLPQQCQRVLELTARPDADAEELRRVIQSDPAFVAKILRRVNSSYFGLSHKVADVKSAVSLLGMSNVRNLTLTIFTSKMFSDSSGHGRYRREDLWSHCVAVAAIASLIARVCGRPSPEDAYTAGLLHDLGYILLDQSLRRHFHAILDEIDESTPTHEVENRTLTFDHAALGGFVAKKWQFAEATVDAISFHHRTAEYEGPHKDLLAAVAVADYLCGRFGHTSLGVFNTPAPPPSTYAQLGLDQASLGVICGQLEAVLKKSAALATV